jgi:Domain of unknown function (DUF4283)
MTNTAEYPTNIPQNARVFLQYLDQLIMDTDRLFESYVVHARFVENNSLPQLNRDISRALSRGINFELSHLSGVCYLLAFNSNITHQEFNAVCDHKLNKLGYLFFLWTPVVKSKQEPLGFKVWLELIDLPLHCWSAQEIPTLASSFGLVLTHSSGNSVI